MHYLPPSPPTSPTEAPVPQPRLKRKRSNHSDDGDDTQRKHRPFDVGLLEHFLSHGGSPNVRDKQDLSLLCRACQLRSLSAVKRLLLQPDLDIDAVHGPKRLTALHIATLTGFHQAVLLLLRHGARVTVTDALGRTALDLAVMHRQEHCVQHIIDHKHPHIHLHTPTSAQRQSILEQAIIAGSAPILRRLLASVYDDGDDDDDLRIHLIEQAVFWNRVECLDFLLSTKKQTPCQLHSALYQAVQQRKLDMVHRLRKLNANPCKDGGRNPCLLYAANHGFFDMIPALLTESTQPGCIQQALIMADSIGCCPQVLSIIHTWTSSRAASSQKNKAA